ncbi:hypothetical protein B0T25DRAFT_117414 [Lasiosphaeria hispida]|uniref:Uncharacterized protein n=1 Tax=Lasiosphaeria hispida TaxID=260671 RepID=A0AAJ0HRB3_9PEZI|nr:hypothetical protein B0T25DRAFT_117414 [Lasiosphaeria hispida]
MEPSCICRSCMPPCPPPLHNGAPHRALTQPPQRTLHKFNRSIRVVRLGHSSTHRGCFCLCPVCPAWLKTLPRTGSVLVFGAANIGAANSNMNREVITDSNALITSSAINPVVPMASERTARCCSVPSHYRSHIKTYKVSPTTGSGMAKRRCRLSFRIRCIGTPSDPRFGVRVNRGLSAATEIIPSAPAQSGRFNGYMCWLI